MTNPILETHKSGTSNTILVSHSWPPGNSNSVLASHAGDYPGGGVDTTPDAFSFVDQTGVAQSTLITSAAVTITGINSAATVTVSGGEWDKNDAGSWSASSGTVVNNDTVKVRRTSSASYSTGADVTLTVGGVSDTFTCTTLADPGSFTAVLNTSTGVLTITDPSNGLGTKSPVAPYFFNPLDTVVDGTYSTDETVGFQIYNTEIDPANRPYVTAGDGIGGGKAVVMRCQYGTGSYLHKPMITRLFTPVGQTYSNINGGETTQFFMSYFLKWHQTTPYGAQVKIFRAAESEGSNTTRTSTNANDYYGNYPNMATSIDIDSSGAPYSNHWGPNAGATTIKPLSAGTYDPDRDPPAGTCLNDLQQCFEFWIKQNTGTSSNAEFFAWQNGKNMMEWTTAKQGDNPVPFGHVIVFTGPDFESSADITYYLSRPYIDFTRQRVVLGDNSDFNACLIHFPLGLSEWTPGGITATDAKNIPPNCDYVFVLDASNNVVSNGGTGFAYSTV